MIFGFGILRKGFGYLRKEKKKREELSGEELSWDSKWRKEKKKKEKEKKGEKNEGRRWFIGTRVLKTRFPGERHVEKVPT